MTDFLEKTFRLKEHQTDVRTEILAGITTFMTMAYILAVNPGILSAAGMDAGAVFTATALGACFGTLLMALFSNYPFALAPGMGLNAFFAYTVVGQMGYSWQVALAAVFVEGILFIVRLYPFKAALADGTFWSTGIGALLALIGILLTAVMMTKKVPGGILVGILVTWGLGMICELTGIYVPNPKLGMFSVMPSFANGISVPSLAPTFMQLDFSAIFTFNFITIMLSFMFVDLFDTLGTLIGVASKAKMLDKDGKLPKIEGALLADSIATTGGALLGTSTVTTFVESSAGVAVGGRTGLTAVTAAVLFFLSLFFAPIFLAIPAFATAPALVIVGFLMVSSLLNVDFDDMTEAIPAFIAAVAMPFMYSISEGISMGVISYVAINLLSGEYKNKKTSWIVYVLAVIFILKYIYV